MDGAKSHRARWLPKRGASGFTIVETMVAFTILAFGLLAMLAMMTAALQGGQVGRHATDAARIARDQLEYFHRIGWTDGDLAPTGWTAPRVVTNDVQSVVIEQEMTYGLSWRIANDAGNPDLRLIDVVVTWQEGNDRLTAPIRRVAMSSVRYDSP